MGKIRTLSIYKLKMKNEENITCIYDEILLDVYFFDERKRKNYTFFVFSHIKKNREKNKTFESNNLPFFP